MSVAQPDSKYGQHRINEDDDGYCLDCDFDYSCWDDGSEDAEATAPPCPEP